VDTESPGSMALFCAACPQPGINLPVDWTSDPDQTAYSRSFVMDGNFKAVHQHRKNAVPDKCLTDGQLYMANESDFKAYSLTAQDSKQVWSSTTSHGYDLNCARHQLVMSITPSTIGL
jgi:hypothetical protein